MSDIKNQSGPGAIDAYSMTPEQFAKEWRDLGKSTTPAPPSDEQTRDDQGRFIADDTVYPRTLSDTKFAEGWSNLGHPPRGDGHPVVPFKRIAELRDRMFGRGEA